MTAYQDVKFQIVRQTDLQIVKAFLGLREAGLLPWTSTTINLRIGKTIETTPEDVAENEILQEVLAQNSDLIRSLILRIDTTAIVSLTRQDELPTDLLHLRLGNGNENQAPQGFTTAQLLRLEAALKRKLHSIDYKKSISTALGSELKAHYEHRESELTRLEAALASAQERVLQQALLVREQLESEFHERTTRIESEARVEAYRRKKELDSREDELLRRLKEVDDREARHVRRGIRQDLKSEFARRGEKFELTSGTRQLRRPISQFVLALLSIFGTGFIAYSIVSLTRFATNDGQSMAELVSLGLKQLFFGLAFGSTSLFFIRWQNQWFQRHAQEEFRLKRLELDFDRASWIVEMALEWRDEKGGELPPELLSRLTNRIFEEGEAQTKELHPVDQLASAIFGASAGLTVKLPTGTELQLDRKSIRELEQLKNAE